MIEIAVGVGFASLNPDESRFDEQTL